MERRRRIHSPCHAFGCHELGETPDAARKALDEAVHLFLVTARDMGTIEEVLQEAGYECKQGKWVSPEWVSVEKHYALLVSEHAQNYPSPLERSRKGFSGGWFSIRPTVRQPSILYQAGFNQAHRNSHLQ